MNCPNCQKPIPPNARFCGACGQSVNNGSTAPPPPEPPRPTIAAAPAAAIAEGGSAPASTVATAASSSVPGLIERVKNIVLSPKLEWPVIAPESTSIAQLYIGYVMPLSALAALLSFVHMSLIGVSVPFAGAIRTPIASGLVYSVIAFGFGLVGLFLVGLIINALAPTFSGVRDQRQALKVAAYSLTPAWLSSILALSPVLPTLLQLIAGLYGIYVLYLGLPIVMRSPREKAAGYTAAVVICTILLGILFGVLSATAGHFGLMPGSLASNSAARAAAGQEQGANIVGNIIGNALGTDDKGKAGLTAALSNLVKAGQQSEQQTPAGDANNATSDSAQNPVSAATGLLTALGGAMGGNHRVEVVDFKALTPLLPGSLPGMKRLDAKGETQGAVGVKTASATANYQGDNGAGVQIVISDMSGVSGLMDLAGALVQNTTSQSDSGYEKDTVISGRSVHEKYDSKARKGDLSVMLAKRFQVEITGDGVDMSSLEQALGQIDLARLESMKDQGAQPK
jgi:Yip1 domain/zinc-ribbon domain